MTALADTARAGLTVGLGRVVSRCAAMPDAAWHLRPAHQPGNPTTSAPDAGPISSDEVARWSAAPRSPVGALRMSLGYTLRGGDVQFANAAAFGDVHRAQLAGGPGAIVTLSHPAHIASIMAKPELAPSATRMSPLRPIVGPNSVLTSVGARHKRQRALLLPQFHGQALAQYRLRIEEASTRRIDAWQPGNTVRLADIAQRITLDVIMSAVFGIGDGVDGATPAEHSVRTEMVKLLALSIHPLAPLAQLLNARSTEPTVMLRRVLRPLNRAIYAVIAERRSAGGDSVNGDGRLDILAVLLAARTEDGIPLPDSEIRDELLTLVLAGHETTSNSVAWTFERLTRYPAVYERAKAAARADDQQYLEAVVNESMRSRPVVPVVARELLSPWRFGEFSVDKSIVAVASALLLHHREELYPKPFAFDPERFVGVKPSPSHLMPFGGGNRRCLGAGLAMAELQVVVAEILRRVDLATTDAPAERPRHRNVTMIPGDGGLVRALARA